MTTNTAPSSRRRPGPRSVSRANSADPIRENFYELLRRSYLRAISSDKEHAVYQGIARTLTQMCAEPWFRSTVFSGESNLVQLFLKETRLPVDDVQSVVARSLCAHAWARTFGETLEGLDQHKFMKKCTVTGKEHLEAALAAGRGVIILHTHTVLGELFWNWLDHQNIERGLTLWQWTFAKNQSELADPKVRAIENARELHRATGILRSGGLVHVMADGQRGRQKVDIPIYRRLRQYFTGFAALALSAQAPVITAATLVEANGTISIVIGSPIEANSSAIDTDRKIISMVLQYAIRHEQLWRDHPENIPWVHMRQHLEFPCIG